MARFITVFVFILILKSTSLVIGQKTLTDEKVNYLDLNWRHVATHMPAEWYGSNEAKMAADSVLKYQTKIGGWAKNSGFHTGNVNQEEWKRIEASGIGATFDNGATTTEMKFLARVYSVVKDERYRESFRKALNYIFKTQYPNGGWPQFYPYRKRNGAYSSHITYNDNSMVNIMLILRDIMNGNELFEPLQINDELIAKAKRSFDKGIECILKTQIIVDGEPTVWCAQHDEFTLAPANARSYELASFSGSESVGIVLLLMDVEDPSADIIKAVKGSVKWFENHKIEGIRVADITNGDGQKDLIVINDTTTSPLWARFYDLETGNPFFCDRDGIKKNTLAEIGYNRRTDYVWYVNSPDKVLRRYPVWAKQWGIERNE
ncbi:MAG: pectate lyase [Bacteroidales bacterium]|nr:pectate lyase [Bacteroidales bacterium]